MKALMPIIVAIFMVATLVLPASAQTEEDENIDAEWSASIFQPDEYEAEMVVKLTIEGEEFSSNGFVPSCEDFSLGEYETIPIFAKEWTYILEIHVEEQEYLLLKLLYIQIDKEGQVGTTQKIANPFLGKCINSRAPKTSFAINYSPIDENSPEYDEFRNRYIAEAIINGVVYDFGGSPDPDSISKYGIECSKEMEYQFLNYQDPYNRYLLRIERENEKYLTFFLYSTVSSINTFYNVGYELSGTVVLERPERVPCSEDVNLIALLYNPYKNGGWLRPHCTESYPCGDPYGDLPDLYLPPNPCEKSFYSFSYKSFYSLSYKSPRILIDIFLPPGEKARYKITDVSNRYMNFSNEGDILTWGEDGKLTNFVCPQVSY